MTLTIASNSDTEHPKRAFCTHTPKWQRFQPTLIIPSEKAANLVSKEATEVHVYQRQYSHVYDHRLKMLKPRCWKALEAASSASTTRITRVNRILELREEVHSMVVGTIVKEAADPKEEPLTPNSKCRPSDQLFLEDDSGRVALNGPNVHQYCTGVVVGAIGKVDNKGTLQVETMVPPSPVPPPSLSGSLGTSEPAPHLLLVSALKCGDPNVSSLPRDMLLSYLQGHFDDKGLAQKVCRVLICGGGPSSLNPLAGVQELDAWGLALTKTGIPIDILPAQNDPTTANWPQRPFHSSLFPHASQTNLWNRSPNPYAAGHGTRLVVGTDGENVADLKQSILMNGNDNDDDKKKIPTDIQALGQTLEWAHMCPTGPDSVPTVPHSDMDPMVLDQTPHVYFCGSSQFATGVQEDTQTRLICVPPFAETGEAVLVNLETCQVELLRFEEEK
jgi:DNA polymerase delta subunit 2